MTCLYPWKCNLGRLLCKTNLLSNYKRLVSIPMRLWVCECNNFILQLTFHLGTCQCWWEIGTGRHILETRKAKTQNLSFFGNSFISAKYFENSPSWVFPEGKRVKSSVKLVCVTMGLYVCIAMGLGLCMALDLWLCSRLSFYFLQLSFLLSVLEKLLLIPVAVIVGLFCFFSFHINLVPITPVHSKYSSYPLGWFGVPKTSIVPIVGHEIFNKFLQCALHKVPIFHFKKENGANWSKKDNRT